MVGYSEPLIDGREFMGGFTNWVADEMFKRAEDLHSRIAIE
jgi:hypothetical protein